MARKRRTFTGMLALLGPIALGVLVYAGQLQASPLMSWFPVDLTLTLCALGAAACLTSVLGRRQISIWILLPIGLWMLFTFAALAAPGTEYAASKTRILLIFTLFFALAPFALLRSNSQRKAFVVALAVVCLAGGVMTLIAPDEGYDVIMLAGTNTIGTARIAGTGALIFFILALTLKSKGRRLLCLILAALLVFVLAASGSRGPVLGIIVGVAGVVFLAPVLKKRRFGGIALTALGSAGAYWWASKEVATDRAFAWLSGERDESTNIRQYLWRVASERAAFEPFGAGLGGFALNHDVPSTLPYPHNLFIEVYYEAGWITGTVLVLFIAASLVRLWRRAGNPISAVLFGLLLFALANAMVSGDINDNRMMWMLLSCAWILPRAGQQQAPSSGSLRPTVPVASRTSRPLATRR